MCCPMTKYFCHLRDAKGGVRILRSPVSGRGDERMIAPGAKAEAAGDGTELAMRSRWPITFRPL